MNYYCVIGSCDEKETITPPEIKHLQGLDQKAPERFRKEGNRHG